MRRFPLPFWGCCCRSPLPPAERRARRNSCRRRQATCNEVEAGKIAATKGKSDAVKQFGQHMVEAHSQTTAELKGIV